MASAILKSTPHGKRVFPIQDEDLQKMLKDGTAKIMQGNLYEEIPRKRKTRSDKGKPRKNGTYETKVQTAEK